MQEIISELKRKGLQTEADKIECITGGIKEVALKALIKLGVDGKFPAAEKATLRKMVKNAPREKIETYLKTLDIIEESNMAPQDQISDFRQILNDALPEE